MPKKYIFALISIFLMLTGCQAQANDNTLKSDAEEVYMSIKNEFSTGEYMSDYQQGKVDEFRKKYINNHDKYKNEEKLLLEMDKLLSSYQLYYVNIGLNEKERIKTYKDSIDESLSELDKQFNK